MRTAITVSALAHALFWGLNALSAPAPIATPPETAITVDIVSPDEIGDGGKPPVSEKANSPEASAPNATTQSEALASNNPPSPPLRPSPQREAARQPQQASQTKSTRAPAQSAAAAQAKDEPTPSGAAAPAPQDEPKSEPKPELPQFGSSWLDAALSSLPVTASHYEESADHSKSLATGYRDVQGAPAKMLEPARWSRRRRAIDGGLARLPQAQRNACGGADHACSQRFVERTCAVANRHARVASVPALRLSALRKIQRMESPRPQLFAKRAEHPARTRLRVR